VALVLPASANPEGVDETVFCEPQSVGPDDTFEFEFAFPEELFGPYLLGVVSGVGAPAGIARVNALVLRPQLLNQPPTIAVTLPDDNEIDFGGTGLLQASGSDPDGDDLSYLWAQVSGPPAAIAAATSPQTEFTLGVGRGGTRVAFQVIAWDDAEARLPSLPVEVEYRMPDNFHVREIGVSDLECSTADDCAAAATDTLSASRGRVTIWVNLLNLNEGDLLAFEIRNPAGEAVLAGRICEPAERSVTESFWRFGWTGSGLAAEAGHWQGVFLRNGVEEASVTFWLAP
jgi:hypothetical protein